MLERLKKKLKLKNAQIQAKAVLIWSDMDADDRFVIKLALVAVVITLAAVAIFNG